MTQTQTHTKRYNEIIIDDDLSLIDTVILFQMEQQKSNYKRACVHRNHHIR